MKHIIHLLKSVSQRALLVAFAISAKLSASAATYT